MPPETDIETLALEYFDRLLVEGAAAMDELRKDYPAEAERILGALEQLARVALVDDDDTPEDAGD